MYEEGTPLYKMLEQGKIEEIDEELSRNMYDTLVDMLTISGYEHYEISNLQNQATAHDTTAAIGTKLHT